MMDAARAAEDWLISEWERATSRAGQLLSTKDVMCAAVAWVGLIYMRWVIEGELSVEDEVKLKAWLIECFERLPLSERLDGEPGA